MTVQELFKNVDVTGVLNAYIMIDNYFSGDNSEISIAEKYRKLERVKSAILQNIKYFCEIRDVKDVGITLCIYEETCQDPERMKSELDSVVIDDKAANNLDDKYFTLFEDNGDINIECFCFDMVEENRLAGYKVSSESIDTLGKELCAAYILSEIFFWGFDYEERAKRMKDMMDELYRIRDSRADPF